MPEKAFVLCIAPELGAHQVVCTVPDDSPQTLAHRLGGKYREESNYSSVDFSDIWERLPPLTEDTPGLEDEAQDIIFDGDSLDSAHVLAVGPVNIALYKKGAQLFLFEVPFARIA